MYCIVKVFLNIFYLSVSHIMQRIAFDRSVSDGFRTAKVESIVSTLQGRRLFVGTADGFLTLYECRQDHSVAGCSYVQCFEQC